MLVIANAALKNIGNVFVVHAISTNLFIVVIYKGEKLRSRSVCKEIIGKL